MCGSRVTIKTSAEEGLFPQIIPVLAGGAGARTTGKQENDKVEKEEKKGTDTHLCSKIYPECKGFKLLL